MDEKDIEKALDDLNKTGDVNKIIDIDNKKVEYSLTKEGIESAKKLLQTDGDAFAFMFQIVWNGLINDMKKVKYDSHKIILVLNSSKAFYEMTGKDFFELVKALEIDKQIKFDLKEFFKDKQ